ncbi:RNA 2',3'-cyclic phosphodiesterase [Erythrobacter alti]|uniref:RNA 2',3'-cyclic phosphodiesterase n=1 Tax=Erythrobacter alti TaxID=1896145 RepID=UPI0030F40199
MASRRLFVALRPTEDVCEALLDTMEGVAGARWQDADNLHITLRFIGEVDRHTFSDVVTALESVRLRAFSLALSGVGHFEGKHRAKAIWAAVAPSPELDDLQLGVEMACRRAVLAAETRKFIPHVTLARLNAGSGTIGQWLSEHGDLALGPWDVNSFTLYESDLTPNGAIYRELVVFQ